MIANEAPEKIYIDANEDWHKTYTAFTEKAKGNDIEYIHTDAFIKKAASWLMENASDYKIAFSNKYNTGRLVEDFVEYMKK